VAAITDNRFTAFFKAKELNRVVQYPYFSIYQQALNGRLVQVLALLTLFADLAKLAIDCGETHCL
jgi:hypothetical protein